MLQSFAESNKLTLDDLIFGIDLEPEKKTPEKIETGPPFMERVAIINYGLGNLASVKNAFLALHVEAEILSSPHELGDYSHIVLPGVGAFGDGMENLRQQGWIGPMEEVVLEQKKPFLGICLGMQLLAERGTENGDCAGLGWIEGEVLRLQPSDSSLRVPHVGWNDSIPVHHHGLYQEGFAEKNGIFYFVHSYCFYPSDESVVDGWCDYGGNFAASLSKDHIWAVQFHPEKSQHCGLALLRNFLRTS